MNVDYKMIGARIRDARKKQGFTQEYLAEKLDVTVGYVSQVERGITRISLDLLAAVCTALGCDMAELVVGSSTGTEQYLSAELGAEFKKLTRRERQLTLEFIKMLVRNRE